MYGMRIIGKSGSFQFDGISLNMFNNGIRTHRTKSGYWTESWNTTSARYCHFANLPNKPNTALMAIQSDDWVRIGKDHLAQVYDQTTRICQSTYGVVGNTKIYSFTAKKVDGIDTNELYGLRIDDKDNDIVSGRGILKIIDVITLPDNTTNWSYTSKNGEKLAVIFGGGLASASSRFSDNGRFPGVQLSHTYCRTTNEDTTVELSFRTGSWAEKDRVSKETIYQKITLSVIIVDVTDLYNIPDF